MDILEQIKRSLPTLSKAESKVAEAILARPEEALNITTAKLAKIAHVSDPMISRFCQTLGCSSFPAFKVALAKSLANSTSFISEAVSLGDSTSKYIEKRINANQEALEYIRKKLRPEIIDSVVERLKNSRQIIIFGMGGAAAIGRDAQHKLFRLGIPTVAYEDHLMQRMAAAGADQDTCILIFSFTGKTKALIEIAHIAKESNANVIAISNPQSPLSKIVDITIPSGDELEDTKIYVPMTSRIVILTIIDILVTGLALALGPKIETKLSKIKHSLDDTKVR